MALVAGILTLRQKFYPSATSILDINATKTAEEDFDKKMLTMLKRMDVALDTNTNANGNANSNANTNINTSQIVDKKEVLAEKFYLVLYPQVQIDADLNINTEKKISTASLSTKDEKDKVLEFYKEQLTDQAKEIESVNEQSDDKLETSLILFSGEGGEGELNVKIWRSGEQTNIDLSISDNFKDPRSSAL